MASKILELRIETVNTEQKLEISKSIREKVFVKEQGVPHDLEMDGYDGDSLAFLIYDKNDDPIATTRVRSTHNGNKIERFAVLKEHRSKGVGQYLISYIVETFIHKNPSVLLYLHAQEAVIAFYEKAGFIIKGDKFEEAGIIHVKMVYNQTNVES